MQQEVLAMANLLDQIAIGVRFILKTDTDDEKF